MKHIIDFTLCSKENIHDVYIGQVCSNKNSAPNPLCEWDALLQVMFQFHESMDKLF
jgi:hypothetical protein